METLPKTRLPVPVSSENLLLTPPKALSNSINPQNPRGYAVGSLAKGSG